VVSIKDNAVGMAMRIDYPVDLPQGAYDLLASHLQRDSATGALLVAYVPNNRSDGEIVLADASAALNRIAITTDERLIEAANVFEGKPFGVGDGVLRHPAAWKHLWNPWKPSWGEPYEEQISRMLAAIFAANKAANGKDAICVSHQLPIWILRSAIENRRLLHDPRKRECTLASVTSVHFDDEGMISGLTYSEPAGHLLPEKK
jgi:broad specificity phosphatase PhoE